jgi:hypothetical protein
VKTVFCKTVIVSHLAAKSNFADAISKVEIQPLEKRARSKKRDKQGGFYISLNSAMLSAMTMIPATTPNIDEWALP